MEKINMKKIILTIFMIFIISNIFSAEYKWISAEAGLRFRSEPNLKSDTLSLIPYNSQVEIISGSKNKEKIGNIEDYWYNILWNSQKGWVFGGFLSNNPKNIVNKIGGIELLSNNNSM